MNRNGGGVGTARRALPRPPPRCRRRRTMIPRRVVRAMGWLRRTGTTVVLVDGGGEAEAAGEEERGGVDAHDLMKGGEGARVSRARGATRSRARSGTLSARLGWRGVRLKRMRFSSRRARGVAASALTVFSGEPMDQSALTRTSRLTATACVRVGRIGVGGVSEAVRRTVGVRTTPASRVPRNIFSRRALRGARAHLLGGEGLLRASELGADGGGGGDGLHCVVSRLVCRTV